MGLDNNTEFRLEAEGYPPALVKACIDEFSYWMGLRSGLVMEFSSATPCQNTRWVHINGALVLTEMPSIYGKGTPKFERGMDVQVSEIEWIVDAPWGS